MMQENKKDNPTNLTHGSVGKRLILFALPFLLSSFLQTFYGMADLYVIGLYNDSASTAAVSIGSQIMHMLTVMIIGLAMGATVHIGRAVGSGDLKDAARTVGTALLFFMGLAVLASVFLYTQVEAITRLMMTPEEAVADTVTYLKICFLGLIFIMAYNVFSSIFRGAGDSASPMIFVALACVINVILDFLLVGGFHMGAAGAAYATICGQAVSSLIAGISLMKKNIGFKIHREDIRIRKVSLGRILQVGVPVSMQDGMIQIAFIVITVIANRRGLTASTAVGIVEKIISFLFMVPSAFLSALSAVTAQNMGAGKPERARKSLYLALCLTVGFGLICFVYNQFLPQTLVGLFTKDSEVLNAGCQYLRAYSADCAIAAVHFCFSGYFCGDQKSILSFIHNIISVLLVRVPGAYLASVYFPTTLFPMGMAAPMGSALSVLICVCFYCHILKKDKKNA